MKSLGDLISKHPIPGMRLSLMRHVCAETLTELLSIKISPSKVHFDAGVLTLNTPPVVKSAILLRQKELRERLKEKGITCTEVR